MTPERARKIAQACADSWYGGAAGLTLKEAITQGILEACQETEGDLVATRAERDSYRQDLAAARADAERYRWLRDKHEYNAAASNIVQEVSGEGWDAAWDAAIDAALAGKGEDMTDKFRLLYGEAMEQLRQRSDELDAAKDEVKLWRDRYSSLYWATHRPGQSAFDRWQREVDEAYRDDAGS